MHHNYAGHIAHEIFKWNIIIFLEMYYSPVARLPREGISTSGLISQKDNKDGENFMTAPCSGRK